MSEPTFVYSVLHAWSDAFYADLLTLAHQMGDRTPINMGTKEDPDIHVFYMFKKDLKIYALPEEHISQLPILVTESFRKVHYRNVYDVITSFKSARFKPVKVLTFRQMVDDLCAFNHLEPDDYVAWKITALSALLGRSCFRVCSQPAFGKDSVMKVLGYLTGDVCVIANPTVAKLEYRLTNKVILLNEFANLKAEDKYGMEHFLQSVGDLSNTYEKRSRATAGTTEKFNIGDLSVICAYNDLSCYQDDGKYFDNVFSQQTKERFIPFKFRGKISEQIENVKDPKAVAMEKSEYLQGFMRSIAHYRKYWREELGEKRDWPVRTTESYGFASRWATNFDTIRDFVLLYSVTPEEAEHLLNILYNRHVEYKEMVGAESFLDRLPKVSEKLEVVQESIF